MAGEESGAPKGREFWIDEAVETFFRNAEGLDPTDPVAAVGAYFERTAGEELKARARAEGRTPAKCWSFVEAVARKVLKGRDGHIDPTVVYALAMHWYEDVPVDWDAAPASDARMEKVEPAAEKAAPEEKAKPEKRPAPKKMAAKKKPAPRNAGRQSFFFDLLEGGAPEAGAADGGSSRVG